MSMLHAVGYIYTIDHTCTSNVLASCRYKNMLYIYVYSFCSFPVPNQELMGHIYTTDLLCLEHSSLNRATDVDRRLLTVHTPLILTSWKQRLLPHPDQDFVNYVLNGIKKRFCIGRNTLHPLQSASKNMSSARENPQVIEEYLQNEIQQGNILGPFLPHTAPAVHIKRFGVIPKNISQVNGAYSQTCLSQKVKV